MAYCRLRSQTRWLPSRLGRATTPAMMSMKTLLLVALGGAIGVLSRHLLGSWLLPIPTQHRFPSPSTYWGASSSACWPPSSSVMLLRIRRCAPFSSPAFSAASPPSLPSGWKPSS